MDKALRALAAEAGIASEWTDASGRPQRVSVVSLRGMLDALGYPSKTKSDIAESRQRLRAPTTAPPLVTATVGEAISLHGSTEKDVPAEVGSSRVDLQACKLEYSIVSPK